MSLTFKKAEKRLNDTLIFPSFDLSIEPGNIVALHSSVNVREHLIDLLLEKTILSNGEISVDDHRISNSKKKIGFLFLHDGLYERLTIEEILTFSKKIYNSTVSINETILEVQLESKRKTRIALLSRSEKRRVQFACLLIQDPGIYILEEPDQNLDLESKRIFLSILHTLQRIGKTVFILTGNMESAVIAADDVYRLDESGLHAISIESEDDDAFGEEKSQITETIQPVRFEKIPTRVNEKIVLFDPPEIDYIESNEGQSYLHIKGESFPCVFTLNELEERLLPFGFFRCHRSYIVNLQKVREVITWTRNSFSLVLEDVEKSTVPLSKTKMAELKEMLGLK